MTSGNNDIVTITWTDNAVNETGYRIQRATNAAFSAGLTTSTVGANSTSYMTGNLPRGVSYYFRVQSYNPVGASGWTTATPAPVVTP